MAALPGSHFKPPFDSNGTGSDFVQQQHRRRQWRPEACGNQHWSVACLASFRQGTNQLSDYWHWRVAVESLATRHTSEKRPRPGLDRGLFPNSEGHLGFLKKEKTGSPNKAMSVCLYVCLYVCLNIQTVFIYIYIHTCIYDIVYVYIYIQVIYIYIQVIYIYT